MADKKEADSKNRIMGAGDLLAGILSDTGSEADQEQKNLESQLAQKASVAKEKRSVEAERKRLIAEKAMAEEAERQRKAAEMRHREMELLIEPEPMNTHDRLAAQGDLPAPPLRQLSGDYAAAVLPRDMQSYIHLAVKEKRLPLWVKLAGGAVASLMLAAGLFFTVLKPAPPIDPTSYPKLALAFDDVGSRAEMIGLAWIPVPEPLPTTIVDNAQDVAEANRTDDRRRDRDRDRRRDRDRESDTSDEEIDSSTIQLDLDGSNLFDRGGE